ncbi:hypothetical protein LTR09_006705 [Extremus antarcticus]|uniref:Uncharacterized protein n=1 Tax=Extremus antarcticus TaxID=702011 RepID=A0AAJ0DKQ8_9PEZI|nr:hypothetical protein LTR09_006705 [Extremus antarcticus]
MASTIDNGLLRNSTGPELTEYFQRLLTGLDGRVIFKHLLDSIYSEAISPRVATIWIHGFADTEQLLEAIQYEHSRMVRRTAIRRFCRSFNSNDFPHIWKTAGGPAGLLQLMTKLSVRDVAQLCRRLAAIATRRAHLELRQRCMTELVKALASDFFPESALKNPERRPLLRYYAIIVPACTTALVEGWQANGDLPAVDQFRVYQAHTAHFQEQCLKKFDKDGDKFNLEAYRPLFRSLPHEPASKHMSASMEFALQLLVEFAGKDGPKKSFSSMYAEVARPLLTRLEKRKHTQGRREHAIKNLVQGLRPSADPGPPFDIYGLFGFVLRLWTEDPDLYESLLVDVLKILQGGSDDGLDRVASSLHYGPDLNLRLLKLELLHLRVFKVKLEEDSEIVQVKPAWPYWIFLGIPKTDGRDLLERLRRLHSDDEFIVWSDFGSLDNAMQYEMLDIRLCADDVEASRKALEAAERHRRKAATSRDQFDRASSAASALTFTAVSKSLDGLEDIVVWLRRFNRDTTTVKQVYAGTARGFSPFSSEFLLDLLSGTAKSYKFEGIDKLKKHIQHVNRIMLMLLETACMVLREPHFHAKDWRVVGDLFNEVTQRRMDSVGFLEKMGLDDDQIYEAVFEDTLQTLVKAELVGLEDGHQRLGFNIAAGPLAWLHDINPELLSKTVNCRFLDEVAKSRDETWERHRKETHSAIVTLPAPWTKRLPIQYLLHGAQIESCGEAMPYLLSRATSIVFIDGSAALADQPTDKDTTAAIGAFVDDYPLALRFYLHTTLQGESQKLRSQRAWDHAVHNLTDSSMSAQEAFYYWKRFFEGAGVEVPDTASNPPARRRPSLPTFEDPTEPIEWNPDPEPDRWVLPSRSIRATCLQSLLRGTSNRDLTVHSEFVPTKSHTVGHTQEPIWEHNVVSSRLNGWRSVSPPAREALIAAALLLLKSHHCSESNILASPFPSDDDARFPAMYLDDEFLDREDIRCSFIWPVLIALKQEVPSSLGVALCKPMLKRLETKEKAATVEHTTFKLMKRVLNGDRPQSCLELVKHVIVHRPDDSSWHRLVFGPGLLKDLPSGLARRFLTSVADAIKERLQEQSSRIKQAPPEVVKAGAVTTSSRHQEAGMVVDRPPVAITTDSVKTAPLIKVSTVKMLAQVMSSADFIGESFTIDLLVGLFTCSNHIDIRAAIVGSLVTVMLSTKQSETQSKILATLETSALPICTSTNERRLLTEEDWEQHERDGTLPKVEVGGSASPIMGVLLGTINLNSTPIDIRSKLISRLILPTLRQSVETNKRWMSLFLKQHGFQLSTATLPPVPLNPSLLITLLTRHTDLVPLDLFRTWSDVVVTNVLPSDDLRAINKAIVSSPDLRSSDAGSRWLSLWDNRDDRDSAVVWYHGPTVASLLVQPFETQLADGITHEHVMQAFEEQADAVFMQEDGTMYLQSKIFRRLEPTFHKDEVHWRHWRQYCRPLVSKLVEKVEAMRTMEWQRDLNRKPAVLPNTYAARLWLLTWPCMPWQPDHAERLQTFADELEAEIKALTANARPYHERFAELKSAALKVWPQDYCFLACTLGPLDVSPGSDEMSIEDSLRTELADAFIRTATEPKDALQVEAVKGLLRAWRSSSNEEMRMRGMKTMVWLADENEGDKQWLAQR